MIFIIARYIEISYPGCVVTLAKFHSKKGKSYNLNLVGKCETV